MEKLSKKKLIKAYTPISFNEVNKTSNNLADLIVERMGELEDILLEYESYEVVKDEVSRTLDLLRNLKENKKYFNLRVGPVTTFLPRNQPLYAFTCFVIIPSLMASEVHFRIPKSMHYFFSGILNLLEIQKFFPNVHVSSKQRLEFLIERSALKVNPKAKENKPITDVVIFTGTSHHAEQIRRIFDKRVLFIANGAGHNPIVVTKDADLNKAIKAVSLLQFYNQGQDCAAPNAVLVHSAIMPKFLLALRQEVANVKVGSYKDRGCRVGPISESKDLMRIQDFLLENREWLDSSTPGVIRTHNAIVEPTIICKPLALGGNFREIFAPIVYVQEYTDDKDLKDYFEDKRYAPQAMFISLYGKSNYIKSLAGRVFNGKLIHDKKSILQDTNPHIPGVERGTQPYGGYGSSSSSICMHDKIVAMPTLPQRDIYEQVAKPILTKKSGKKLSIDYERFTEIQYKNVEKLLRLQSLKKNESDQDNVTTSNMYLDVNSIKRDKRRYVQIENLDVYSLLDSPNVNHIVNLNLEDVRLVRVLNQLLSNKSKMSQEDFRTQIYAIPKNPKASDIINKDSQTAFFHLLYQLLFGKKFGPKLPLFLFEVDNEKIEKLLNI